MSNSSYPQPSSGNSYTVIASPGVAGSGGSGRNPISPVARSRATLIGYPGAQMEFYAPPPNALRRLIWRVALGVVWKDLRPERALDELAKLK